MIHVTLPTTGPKMSTKDMIEAVVEQAPAKRRPSEIAKELHEALIAKDEQDRITRALEKELSECVKERSVVHFAAWENNHFVNYNAIISPGLSALEYIKEAK